MRPPKGGMSGFSLPSIFTLSEVVAASSLPVRRASKRRIAVLVSADFLAVEVDDRVRHRTIEDERDFVALPMPDRRAASSGR